VTRPLIAVPGVPLKPGAVRTWRQGGYGVPAPYLEALDRAGADGAVLMPTVLQERSAAEVLARFDGLLLPGGGDIDPALYGEEAAPEVAYVSPARDGYEIPVVRHAVEAGLPTLAICRGAQVLNVALGGTLHQHISGREGLIPHRTDDGDAGVLHPVQVEAGSRLAEVLGATEVDGYSHHHQALDRMPPGLRVVATAPDGTVEAVETDTGWVIGIQWHAEATAATDPVQQRLFGAFVEAVAGARR
jgi:putative glutamine amidotransferase